ncbi:hypothetical protein [Bradyrhizobium sp. 30]|uniref:hypothetical protein n=1 Tax=Bradyrhizobium sp. 30 TaxID=2782669 RepID=UPI001FF820CB|nr:hypothetical protein [Bradyrhizobium sp. 30]MCK1293999.1 hypothetical protein [Bradyrhizobium sp. 30]
MTWYNYAPLAPLIEKYSDDGSRDLFSVECDLEDAGLYRVAAVGRLNAVELIRVESVGSDGDLTPAKGRLVSQLIDHMITVLRLTTDQQVERLWFGQETISLGSHGDSEGKPNLGVSISLHSPPDFQIDFDNVAAVYTKTLQERNLFKLLGDSNQPTLPLQYKYLSLYKILEHEFRVGKKWPGLRAVLAPWVLEFQSLAVSRQSLDNFIHDLRDRCAHIKTGNSGELGFTGLSTHDMEVVDKVTPILRKVIAAHLSTKYPYLKFSNPTPITR